MKIRNRRMQHYKDHVYEDKSPLDTSPELSVPLVIFSVQLQPVVNTATGVTNNDIALDSND